MAQKFSIAIHGGAGTILPSEMTKELEATYTEGLQAATEAGFNVLKESGSATEAVLAAVVELENNILFNAGRGSVFTKDGTHEMDASLMDGLLMEAGAVAAVKNIRNPILLAKKVMDDSPHVLLIGEGANAFARQQNLATEPDDYFFSEFRYQQWKLMKDSDHFVLDHTTQEQLKKEKKFGTVGAVACDAFGNVAAATSTGGMTNKRFGRVGDTAIIGAGTYASNKTCAISCTGHGEPFIKAVAAFSVAALMEYKEISLKSAMHEIVFKKLLTLQGEGGMIGVDPKGEVSMQFNSEGMYRAFKSSDGTGMVRIYKD